MVLKKHFKGPCKPPRGMQGHRNTGECAHRDQDQGLGTGTAQRSGEEGRGQDRSVEDRTDLGILKLFNLFQVFRKKLP